MNARERDDTVGVAQTTWEYLPFLAMDAARQMAIDAIMARLCAAAPSRAMFRLYRMDPPAVTIGRNQRWRSVIDEEACRQRGWEWTRRPTGGGSLLHRHEINYAVAASQGVFGERSSFNHAYHCIMRGLTRAVELLGAHPTLNMGRGSAPNSPARSARGLCEQSLTHYEIAVDGKKAVAAAQWYSADTVLQHGTIYLQAPTSADRFWPTASDDRASRMQRSVWWDTSAHATFSDEGYETVTKAIQDGVSQALRVNWTKTDLADLGADAVESQCDDWTREGWNRHR